MGWKASCIFINEGGGDLGSLPSHDPIRARETLNQLGLNNHISVETSSFDAGIYPEKDLLYLGAFPNSFLLCHQGITEDFFLGAMDDFQVKTAKMEMEKEQKGAARKWVHLFLKTFPTASVDVVLLHSSVNLWGYACFESGQRVRTRLGDNSNGTIIDTGEIQPFEEALFSKAIIKNGKRTFIFNMKGKEEEFSDDQVGESFVFCLIEQWFGRKPIFGSTSTPLFEAFELEMEVFREQ